MKKYYNDFLTKYYPHILDVSCNGMILEVTRFSQTSVNNICKKNFFNFIKYFYIYNLVTINY